MTTQRLLKADRNGGRSAFTLVEMLAVLAVMGLLMALVVPATSGIMSGFSLTQQGQELTDKLSLCRQLAMTQNRETELRIVKTGTGTNAAYAYQIWVADAQGANAVAYGRVIRLPETIQINEELSPMMNVLTTGEANFPALGGTKTYHSLRYRTNGSALGAFGNSNYLTISYSRDSASDPKNFYTVQLNPVTGLLTVYRP